jgi:hypothetical protein
VLAIGYWFSGVQAVEHATRVARRLCDEHRVQLLDQTVAQVRLRLRRDHTGRLRWLRDYRFEFTDDGERRSEGFVSTMAGRVLSARLELADHTLHESIE